MHARWLALPLAALTGCATAPVATTRAIPADLQLGAMAHRTSFELEEPPAGTSAGQDDAVKDSPDTDKKKRRRKVLFFLGVGATGFGVLGATGFGIGGRVVQEQIADGYADGSISRDREDTLTTRGETMNGLAIGSAVIGLAGALLAATVYGVDHAKCGDLPPRRKRCPDRDESEK